MDLKEFDIPVFWGHISVKTWGKSEYTAVLMLHGINDNAGSFDRLVPYLPNSLYYICIDLPSHGKSSQFPPNTFITTLDYLLTIKLVLQYFKLEKCVMLGHSYGGQLLILFSQLYPQHVLKLITIDSFYLLPTDTKNFANKLTQRMDKISNMRNLKEKRFEYYDGVDKIRENRMLGNHLDDESAMCLADRCIVTFGKEYYRFTNDPRVSAKINPFFDLNFVMGMLHQHKVQCPFLFIYMKSTKEMFQFYCNPMLEAYGKMEKCKIEVFDKSHDLHMDEPQVIAPAISKFISDTESKL